MKMRQTILSHLCGLVFLTGILPAHSDTSSRLESSFHSLSHISNKPASLKIKAITGVADAPIGKRLDLVHDLGDHLKRKEIGALYDFLKSPPAVGESNLAGLHTLKNDILNTLRGQEMAPEELTDVLAGIYRDENQDSVTRDYAVQHLTGWFEQNNSPGSRAKVRAVLLDAVQNNDSIAGTALLGLHRLSAMDASINSLEINQRALGLALSDESQLAARITAIQICAERNLKKALPTVQSLSQSCSNISLRLSAIAALGRLGGFQEIALLRRLQSEKDETLAAAICDAIKQLPQKQELF